MNPGRLWRTVRHLTAEQWLWRAICRGRRVAMNRFPGAWHARIQRAADALPDPDPSRPGVAAIAEVVLQLQTAVHGETFAAAPAGRFRLLDRDFDFGDIGSIPWRGEFHEGNNPLRRMTLAYMGYAVPLLARGRAEDLAAIERILFTLASQNPFAARGVFRDVWNAYTASHRLINLLCGLALYRRAGGPADRAAEKEILGHVRFCAAFVRANLERDLQYNHLMKNHVALAAFAAGCEAVPAPLSILEQAVARSIRQNVLADGGHAERSPMYHALALLDVRALAASGLYPGTWRDLLAETEAAMARALPAMTLADGEIALLNDSWLGEAPRAAALSAAAAGASAILPETGYARLAGADGAAGDSVVFDCGPCGPDDNPGHAHADFLSVETTIAGRRFLVDTGVPTYTAGEARDSSRSAAAHNGPRLDGAEPIEFWKSFRVGRRGRAGPLADDGLDAFAPLHVAGWQSGYAHLGTDVRRYVGLWPGHGLLVADLWRGRAAGRAATSFLVSGDWALSGRGTFARGGVRVRALALRGALSEAAPAAHWLRFGVESPAHRLELTPRGGDGEAQAAAFFAWGDDPAPPGDTEVAALFDALACAGAS